MENIKETPLCKLAWKYRTDKCPRIKHVYTPFYYKLFKNKRRSVKKVLEVGIGFSENMSCYGDTYKVGASLRMWRDFFPNAQVYGADILPQTMFRDERIKTFLCNEKKRCDVERLIRQTGSDIDLVIDDGVHHYKTQTLLARMMLPLVDEGVTYTIEDISHTRSIARWLSRSGYKCYAPNLPGRKFMHGKLLVVTK